MKVIKIYNNNIVAAINDNEKVSLVTGKGVGYHSKINQHLELKEEWKVFELVNPQFDEYHNLVDSINIEAFSISQQIYDIACDHLNYEINKLLVVVLADHISFKIELLKNKVRVPNLLTAEIRTFYPNEFCVGEIAVGLINKAFNTDLDSDESSYIAMHILNMMVGAQENSVFSITEFIKVMLELVKADFSVDLETTAWIFERLMIHIKYLGQRLSSPKAPKDYEIDTDILKLNETQQLQFDQFCNHADLIASRLFKRSLSASEKLYLSIHVLRILNYIGD